MKKNNKKILLAEDEEFLSKALVYKLKGEGFEVFSAHDGKEALNIARKEKPDLILLDIAMPKISGLEVLEEIKNNKILKKIPVIMISNLSQEKDIKESISRGACSYMVKSNFSMKEIVEKVKEQLEI